MMNHIVKNAHDSLPHNYEEHAAIFTRAVGFEKSSIISPVLSAEVAKIMARDGFDPSNDKMVDVGCGPFLLALPFISDGIHVDGIDPSIEMLSIAEKTIMTAKPNLNNIATRLIDSNKVLLVNSANELKPSDYKIAMLNFVHQCMPDEKSLKNMFQQVANLLMPHGRLIITGAHPDNLNVRHSCCEYDVNDPDDLKDGDKYSGRIYNEMGAPIFNLEGDCFWRLDTLQKTAESVGFIMKEQKDIADKRSGVRQASEFSPYFLMSLKLS